MQRNARGSAALLAARVPDQEEPADRLEGLSTEFSFVLPHGFVDDEGRVHREGVMRLATARDEIAPLRDPRVQQNEAYLTVLLLARVLTRLGSLEAVDTQVVEGMFAVDLSFLQDLYRRINQEGHTQVLVACPACAHEHAVDIAGSGPGGS